MNICMQSELVLREMHVKGESTKLEGGSGCVYVCIVYKVLRERHDMTLGSTNIGVNPGKWILKVVAFQSFAIRLGH